MKKRILSILLTLCMVLLLVPTTAFAEDSVYVVAGCSELCGSTWDPDPVTSPDNVMVKQADGTYQKVYSNVGVMDGYQFKVVENNAVNGLTWHGLDNDDNVTFNVKFVCDVTITFDPATSKITVTGAGVEIPTELNVQSMRALGNGDGNWLNGVAWDPADDTNLMTEVSSGVYEITYTDLDEFDNYQVKFAANGSWDDNWGGVYQDSGVESDAEHNSDNNIRIEVPYELADVTLRLDLTNFDYATKQGAKFTVTVVDKASTSSEFTDISSVAITDIETPAANTTLDTSASCTTTGVSSTTPSVTWTPSDSAAGYNTSYTASITLTADTGYKFADAVTATVSGNNATSVTKNADGTLTVTYAFPEIPDTIDPVISGIENNKTYCDDVEFTVSDNDGIESVEAGGKLLTVGTNGKYTLAKGVGTVTVVATDNAGNNAKVSVTVNNGHTGGEATCTAKAVCEVCGEEYDELDSANHNLEKIPAKDATVAETGNKEYWHCKDCGKCFADENGENEIELNDTVTQKLSPEIIDGKGQSIAAGEMKELTVKSNVAFSDFVRVELDGKTLDEKYYTVNEGSMVVTLKADYVATLSAGEHTIGIVSTNGTATTAFTVNAKAVVDNDTKSPQTGDNSHMALWIALLFVSGAGAIGTTVYGKKKRVR